MYTVSYGQKARDPELKNDDNGGVQTINHGVSNDNRTKAYHKAVL